MLISHSDGSLYAFLLTLMPATSPSLPIILDFTNTFIYFVRNVDYEICHYTSFSSFLRQELEKRLTELR
jgi:hypothetical protein